MIKKILRRLLPLPAEKQRNMENHLLTEIEKISKELSEIKHIVKNTNSISYENIYANVFHDTTSRSEWLNDKVFWPGRSALGYPAMYVTYRILNEMKPKRILELGLGQSTKLISQ